MKDDLSQLDIRGFYGYERDKMWFFIVIVIFHCGGYQKGHLFICQYEFDNKHFLGGLSITNYQRRYDTHGHMTSQTDYESH